MLNSGSPPWCGGVGGAVALRPLRHRAAAERTCICTAAFSFRSYTRTAPPYSHMPYPAATHRSGAAAS